MIHRFQKVIASIALFTLIINSIGTPFIVARKAYAQDAQTQSVTTLSSDKVGLTFSKDTNEFTLEVRSSDALEYTLTYEKSSQTEVKSTSNVEAIVGKLTPENGIAKTTAFAGTCSSGTCIKHNLTNGNLKITSANNQDAVVFNSSFTLTDSVITFPTPTPTIEPTLTVTPEATPSSTPTVEATPSGTLTRTLNNLDQTVQTITEAQFSQNHELLVKFKETSINLDQPSIIDQVKIGFFQSIENVEIKDTIEEANVSVVKVNDAEETAQEAVTRIEQNGNVEYAEPNYQREPQDTAINTDDTLRNNLWGLYNTGQTVDGVTGTNDADIDAPDAWTISEGSPSVVVAVIDTGVAYNHPDLSANMWSGSTCVNENGVSIPGGCNHGYDFEDNDNNPLPTSSSHGTHVAGTIAAVKNNANGIVGVAPQAKIMAIKTSFINSEVVKAIDFARLNGARIINASYGGGGYSQAEYDALARFRDAGGIFIAAAGNNSSNNDVAAFYPATYNLTNIISVAATNQNDQRATFSNYGATTVDVAAPGVNIQSSVASTITSNVYTQNFDATAIGSLPTGWVRNPLDTYFEVNQISGSNRGLFSDTSRPYYDLSWQQYAAEASVVNLQSVASARIGLTTSCDTEFTSTTNGDYLALDLSDDYGAHYYELLRWNEYTLGNSNAYNVANNIPSWALTSGFDYRFRWKTNGNGINGLGCYIDNVFIETVRYNDGSDNQYAYYDGTSMATPHVVGLAALIKSYKPAYTYSEIKNTILTTGDTIPALSGMVATGKRINAYSALQSLVPPVNQAPDAVNDSFTTNEDTAVMVTTTQLLANDTDPESGALTFTIGTATNGTVNRTGNNITFTPTANFNGTGTFTYTITDPEALTDSATVTITVTAVNDAPVLNAISNQSVNENQMLTINLVATDVDTASLTYTGTNIPSNSNLNSSTGVFTFTPDESQGGQSYPVTFSVSDGSLTDNKNATITVNEVTNAPVAVDDNFSVNEDISIYIGPEVLTHNDTDSETVWPNFTVTELKNAVNGTVGWSEGTVVFTPSANFHGTGSFVYVVTDESGLTDEGTVYITVNSVNDAPILNAIGAKSVNEFGTLNINLTGSDADNDTITYSATGLPAHASLTGSTVSFTPDESQGGQNYQVTFTISDGTTTDDETVTITVNEVNNAPVTVDDTASTNEDIALNISTATLLSNDYDLDTNTNAGLSVSTVSNPVNGTVTINAGTITFTPTANFNGAASFEYTITDGNLTDAGLVTITVSPVNDAPVLSAIGNKSVDEGQTLTINLVGTDVDNTSLTYTATNIPTNANVNGSTFTFTPNESQGGQNYQVTFTISDGTTTDDETVTITVNEVNQAPVATNDTASTNEDTAVTINPTTLLANDTDPDTGNNSVLSVTTVSNPVNGTVNLDGTTITFSPTADFHGTASFTYTISDGSMTGNGTVTITVNPVNDAPILEAIGNTSVDEYATLNLGLNATDIDTTNLTYSTSALPQNAAFNATTKAFTFTPDETQGGQSFQVTFTVSDGTLTDNETITIAVNEVNNAPAAVDDSFSTPEDTAITITPTNLIGNDTDVDNATSELTMTGVSNPINGVVSINAEGNSVFTPNTNFNGTASFNYTVSDPAGLTDTGLVTITVTAVNDAPILEAIGNTSVDEYATLNFTVHAADVENASPSLTAESVPANATFDPQTGAFTFTPDETQGGNNYQVIFTVSDGTLTDSETITIVVNEVNNAPVAVDDGASTNEDMALSINAALFVQNDTDPENNELTVTAVSNSLNGTVSLNSDFITFTPSANFHGAASFEYTVTDGSLTDTGLVTITVSPVNDAPTLENVANQSVDEFGTLTITLNGSDIDGDTLTYSATNMPANAALNDTTFTFTPDETQGGQSFMVTFTVSDGSLTDRKDATITVNEVNNAPVAVDDSASTNEDSALTINASDLIQNDTDSENGALTVTAVSNPINGTVSFDGTNVMFTPDADFNGTASFEYAVTDGNLTDTGLVTITVSPVNDAPVVEDQAITVVQNHTKTITLGPVTDVDGDTVTYSITQPTANGTMTVNNNEALYTPEVDYVGTEQFTVTATDAYEAQDTATITTDVVPNTAPVANDQTVETEFNTPVNITLTGTDADSDSLTYQVVTQPLHGLLSNAMPTLTYTPEATFSGTDTFTFSANDGQTDSAEATVTITIKEKAADDNNGGNNNNQNNSSNNSSSNNAGSPYVCGDPKPEGNLTLSAFNVTANSVTLHIEQSMQNISHFALIFTDGNGGSYGTTNMGKPVDFTINHLNPNTIYSFEIIPVNGCMPGNRSNKVAITTAQGTELFDRPITETGDTLGADEADKVGDILETGTATQSAEASDEAKTNDQNGSSSTIIWFGSSLILAAVFYLLFIRGKK